MSKYDRWTDEIKPNKKGWYGVHYCWDVQEGSFCNAFYFNGNDFVWGDIPFPVQGISKKKFRSLIGCGNWLKDNDISF
jgi:hypothetical protein